MPFLEKTFLDNSLMTWGYALAVVAGAVLLLVILRNVIGRRLVRLVSKTNNHYDDLIIELLQGTRWFFIVAIAIYLGSLALTLPDKATEIIHVVVIILILIQGGIWGNTLITFGLNRYKEARGEDSQSTITALGFVGRVILWAVVLLLILDNIPGVEITTLIAGLGVTSVAVALAVQNILGDLFASLSIVLDQPFVIGDSIVVGDYIGTVEHIGLKSTRVRSLSGEEIVFSNSDLLESRIRNYKNMEERRIVFNLGVTYQTTYEQVAAIPQIIEEAIIQQSDVRFDRAHFKEYGDSALIFEVVYYMLTSDYTVYMDTQQAINLELFRRFEEAGIEFAYPTQTLFVSQT
jgi:small-conductance mechanosensitive channel